MFRRLQPDTATVEFTFDGEPLLAAPGDTVDAALLAGGRFLFRSTPVSGAARGPHCMIGNCFDCLVEIDGVPNRQACLVPVKVGMAVRRQDGPVRVRL